MPVEEEEIFKEKTLKSYFSTILKDSVNTFCLLTSDSKTVVKGFGTFHGTYEDVLNILKQDTVGATLHVTCNTTDLKGRKKENIVAPRFLLLDLDRCITDEELSVIYRYNPVACVTSSPNKFHFYWPLCHTTPLEVWSTLQLGLNNYFGGDLTLRDISKTIRVPGVRRLTKSGELWVPELFEINDYEKPLKAKEICKLMPFLLLEANAAKKRLKLEAVEKFKLFKAIRNETVTPLVSSQNIKTEGRNNTMYLAIIDFVTTASLTPAVEEVSDYALKLNALFLPPLDVGELEIVCGKAYRKGLESRRKKLEKLVSLKNRLKPV